MHRASADDRPRDKWCFTDDYDSRIITEIR